QTTTIVNATKAAVISSGDISVPLPSDLISLPTLHCHAVMLQAWRDTPSPRQARWHHIFAL
ncbi:hypothetical protein, partial [Rhodococcus sp. ACS1]|uniref:hypothetical protein n=1 Tax=Rhodococcus sp. ACS1 TaxID=2028570 RepID=UPI001C532AA3